VTARALARGGVAAIAVLAACTTPRTQIVARVDTDMAQGTTQSLTGIAVRVVATGETTPRFDRRYELGVGSEPLFLPADLGLVPADPAASSRVTIEVDALHGDDVLFTRRAIVTFAEQRTLRADIFLADRCRIPENRICPPGTTCGIAGCEVEERPLPNLDDDAGPIEAIDAGPGDAGPEDAGPEDAGPPDAPPDAPPDTGPPFDSGCGADLATDPLHCGACGNVCPGPPANGSASCTAGACGVACDTGHWDAGGTCLPLGMPRAIRPLAASRVTRRRPSFEWLLPPGADGARVDVCADPACGMIETSFTVTGTAGMPAADLATGASDWRFFRLSATSGGTVIGATPSPVWSFDLAARLSTSTGPSTSWPMIYDAEGDGFGDAAIGAPGVAEVHVYRGGTAGLAAAATVLRGGAGSRFGEAIGRGDFDGDGRGDLLVGAPGTASAVLHRGTGAGPAATGTPIAGPAGSDFGTSVAAAGDVDRDGWGDAIVGAPSIDRAFVLRGGPLGLRGSAPIELAGPAASAFGAAVASAGDVNGDFYGDVIVGAPDEGAAYVYFGGPAGPVDGLATRLAGSATSRFGAGVAGGDVVACDGYADVVVVAPGLAQALVFVGSATGIATSAGFTLSGGPGYGTAVALSDLDDSGFEDVLVSTSAGVVHLYYSNSSGPGVRAGWNTTFDGPAGATGWGASLAGTHVGRDFYADVIVGAPGSSSAYLYVGRAGSFSGTVAPAATMTGAAGSDLGRAVAWLRVPRIVRPAAYQWATWARAG
jgi:hypothetical protein